MSADKVAQASRLQTGAEQAGRLRYLGANQRRQLAWITLAAVAVFVALRLVPTASDISHMDFRVTAKNAIDFCDPANPQFIPVVAVASPVSMTLRAADGPVAAGRESRFVLTLATASGKPIGPGDLVVAHERKLHLLAIDESLVDYQHLHPVPGAKAGEWDFSFTPRASGSYRFFADFTPMATGRGLYASADLASERLSQTPKHQAGWAVERDGLRFELKSTYDPIRAKWPTDLRLTIARSGGGAVALEPLMGAYAHLVAFDEARSGFAHLHPNDPDLAKRPDAVKPALDFKLTIPRAGRYVIWAQVSLGGREVLVPFWFEVVP